MLPNAVKLEVQISLRMPHTGSSFLPGMGFVQQPESVMLENISLNGNARTLSFTVAARYVLI